MKKATGFTLIEVVIAIAILGVLAAFAVPRFINLHDDALTASKKGISGAVKSAHAIAIADLKDFPDVTALAGYVQSKDVTPVSTGIQVEIDGVSYIVPTYADAGCSTATGAVSGVKVQCVGNIPTP